MSIPCWDWQKVNENSVNHMIRISQWRESLRRTNTSIRRKKQIQKTRTVKDTIWDLRKKVNHLIKVIWDGKNYKSSPVLPVLPEQVSQSLWWTLQPLQTHTEGGLIERAPPILDETASKTVHKDEEGERRGKWSKTMSEIKPVKNITNNLLSFLEISPFFYINYTIMHMLVRMTSD